jgi:hypothetical protein
MSDATGGELIEDQSFDLKGDEPEYLRDALKDIGVQEWVLSNRRKVSNPVVQRFVAKALGKDTWKGNTITTPWCAYWVNAKLEWANSVKRKSRPAKA